MEGDIRTDVNLIQTDLEMMCKKFDCLVEAVRKMCPDVIPPKFTNDFFE